MQGGQRDDVCDTSNFGSDNNSDNEVFNGPVPRGSTSCNSSVIVCSCSEHCVAVNSTMVNFLQICDTIEQPLSVCVLAVLVCTQRS